MTKATGIDVTRLNKYIESACVSLGHAGHYVDRADRDLEKALEYLTEAGGDVRNAEDEIMRLRIAGRKLYAIISSPSFVSDFKDVALVEDVLKAWRMVDNP